MVPSQNPRPQSLGPRPWRLLTAIAVAVPVLLVICRTYVGAEDGSYYWDWVGYFHAFQATAAAFRTAPLATLAAGLQGVRDADYNLAAVLPLLPVASLFGASRATYVTGLALLYLLPTALLATRIARRADEDIAPLPLFAGALLFWPIWMSVLRGMPDIAGLVPIGAATLLALRTRFLTRSGPGTAAAFGLLIWSGFLIRRWYAYAGVALELATFAFAALALVRGGTADWRTARRFGECFLFNVLALLAALVLVQGPLARRIVETNYGSVYAAYQKPLADTAGLVFGQVGLVALCAVGAGLVRAIRTGNQTVLFTSLLALITGALFLRVQAPGLHHLLPFYFWLFPALVHGLAWPWAARGKPAPVLTGVGVAGLCAAGFASIYVPGAGAWLGAGAHLAPDGSLMPIKVAHPAAYAALIHDVEALSTAKHIAVFASSAALNPSRLGAMSETIHSRLVPTSEVDRRDGFNLPALAADVAVVPATPATHLIPSGQRVVTLPAHWILAREGPGAAFTRRAGPYRLDDGLDAFVYVRERPLADADTAFVEKAFRAIYPDWIMTKDGPGPQ